MEPLLAWCGAVAEREADGVLVDEAVGQHGLAGWQAGLVQRREVRLGQRERMGGDQVAALERRRGRFRRSITLPGQVDADKIAASAQDGVLQIQAPKRWEDRGRRIKVQAGDRRDGAAAKMASVNGS